MKHTLLVNEKKLELSRPQHLPLPKFFFLVNVSDDKFMPEKLWYDNEMICVHPWQVFCLYLICQTLTTTRAGHKTVNNYPAIKVLKHVTGWPLIVSWLEGGWILLAFDYAYVYSLRAVISTSLSVALLIQPSYLTLHDLGLTLISVQ